MYVKILKVVKMNKCSKGIRIAMVVVMLFVMTMCFTGCKEDVSVDDPVTIENVNSSSRNVAQGIVRSIFTRDLEMMYACYPESAAFVRAEDPDELFDSYLEGFNPDLEFYGVSFTANNAFTVENGYDEGYMKLNISMLHNVEEDAITAIELLKERVTFKNSSDDYESSDIYMIVYETEGAWYFFEFADSDADFNS